MEHILRYNPKYYDELEKFYYNNWPERDREYLKYRLVDFPENISDAEKNIIVINDKDEIIGCHLFFPTKALINGIETKIFWGHDTFLKEEYRGDLGVEFMMEQEKDIVQFGAGLSALNYKIQKRIGRPFLGVIHNYVKTNTYTPISLLLTMHNNKSNYKKFDVLNVSNAIFHKISDVSELTIPNNGYWLNGKDEVEFIRDATFLHKRFFDTFRDYTMYAHTNDKGICDMYFVVCMKQRKGFPTITIVDFRYSYNVSEPIKKIVNAASILARKNFIPFTVVATTSNISPHCYSFKLKDNECSCVIGPMNLKLNKPSQLLFNLADSDQDFV